MAQRHKLLLMYLITTLTFQIADGNIYTKSHKCPGIYCGRVQPDDTCGACPRGYRPNSFSQCEACDDRVTFYDALYLGFMALVSLVLHWFFIDFHTRAKPSVLLLHLSALLESLLAALLTLVLSDPVGTLEIRSCHVQQLSDWYTMLYNPSPNYTDTLHCTQEVVYPLYKTQINCDNLKTVFDEDIPQQVSKFIRHCLSIIMVDNLQALISASGRLYWRYTMVMIYYVFSLVLMMILRPFILYKFVESRGTKSIYAALYFLPILIVMQAIFGGLIYYSFPYIILVVSVVTNAVHFASMNEESMRDLMKKCMTSPRHFAILFGHWLLHAYGIIALTRMEDPGFHAPLIGLVPFPAIFYVLTVHFTNPDNLDRV